MTNGDARIARLICGARSWKCKYFEQDPESNQGRLCIHRIVMCYPYCGCGYGRAMIRQDHIGDENHFATTGKKV